MSRRIVEHRIYILPPTGTNERAHRLVASGEAHEARVETAEGHVLFRAWDYADPASTTGHYAWQTASMAAPAFWPKDGQA